MRAWGRLAAGALAAVMVLPASAAAPRPAAASVSLSGAAVNVAAGSSASVALTVAVPATPPAADIEIAIDTTASMTDSIKQAKDEASALVTRVQGRISDARFAVVQFKDIEDGAGEYHVEQPMTSAAALVSQAIGGLGASGGIDLPEAYNLVFHNSAQPAVGGDIGWRAGSRSFVVVIGDAEPHGAGAAGLDGCGDQSADPHGFDTATELAGMATAQRTLFMIRQAATASTTLNCYQSLAARAFTGGQGVDGGTSIADQIVSLITAATSRVAGVHLAVGSAAPAPADAAWISSSPASAGPVTPPAPVTFTLTVTVPAGTPMGTYRFDVVALADGADVGHQALTIVVGARRPPSCSTSSVPPASPPAGAPEIGTYAGGRIDDQADRVAHQPFGVTAAPAFGGTFVADPVHRAVRLLTGGAECVYAGNGSMGTGGDGGAPTNAQLSGPYAVAVDAATGDVFIADTYGHEVRRVGDNFREGAAPVISTVAGTGALGFSGDGGPAARARLDSPYGLAVWRRPPPATGSPGPDLPAILYIADTLNNRVRAVYLGGSAGVDGSIATVAGTGRAGDGGDGGPALSASLNQPRGLAVDARGRLLIADTFNHRVRRFDPRFDPVTGAISGGSVVTVAGNGAAGATGDGGPATAARLDLPAAVAVSPAGVLYVADTANNVVRQVAADGVIRTFAGTGAAGSGGDGGPATAAQLNAPFGVTVGMVPASDGPREVVQIADTGNSVIREVASAPGSTIVRIAGNGTPGLAVPPDDLALDTPAAVASLVGPDGRQTRYVLDTFDQAVRVVNPGRAIPDGPPLLAHLATPMGLAVDPSRRRLYVADTFANVVRQLDLATGSVTTVAGSGASGFDGDGGPATGARLSFPTGLAVDGAGNLLIADTYNSRIRKLDAAPAADGIRHLSTVAGTGVLGSAGDGGLAIAAQLYFPYGVAVDGAGNLYVADSFNDRVRRVDAATGRIATVAGGGARGDLARPWGISAGQVSGRPVVLVADHLHHVVRSLDVLTGGLTAIAGSGAAAFAGDGGEATAASLDAPRGVAFASDGDLSEILVADSFSDRVRVIGQPRLAAGGGDAGDVLVRTTASLQVRLANAGTGVLAVGSEVVVGGAAADFRITSPCAGAVLANGGGCVVGLEVTPSAEGLRTATLRIVEAGNGRVHDVPLSASGTAPRVAVSPTSIAFGPDGTLLDTTAGPATVAVSNAGTAPLAVAAIAVAGGDFRLVPAASNPCPAGAFTLPVHAPPCRLAATFTPTAAGRRTGSVTITSDAANGPAVVGLSGTGVTSGSIDVRRPPGGSATDFCPPAGGPSPTPTPGGFVVTDCSQGNPSVIGQTVQLFAARDSSSTQKLALASTGPGSVVVSSVSVEGDDQFTLAPTTRSDACRLPAPPAFTMPAEPRPGSFCTFQVTFSNGKGSGTATLVIEHSAGETRVPLQGTTLETPG